MSVSAERAISIYDAAKLIFRTSSPSQKQLSRVYEQMKAGTIKVHEYAGSPLKWTTTEAALADFLAAQREAQIRMQRARLTAAQARQSSDGEPAVVLLHDAEDEAEKLCNVYRNIWRDYFLAVMLRRRTQNRSRTFQRSVVAGQVLLLLLLVGTFAGGVRWAVVPTPPEHVSVEGWIAANTDAYAIMAWHGVEPTADGGAVVRVQYRYQKESRRWVHTDRQFAVLGSEVTEISDENR